MNTQKRKAQEVISYGSPEHSHQLADLLEMEGYMKLNPGTSNTPGLCSRTFRFSASAFHAQGHHDTRNLPTCSQISRNHSSDIIPLYQSPNHELKELNKSDKQSMVKFQLKSDKNSSFPAQLHPNSHPYILGKGMFMQKPQDEFILNQGESGVSFSKCQNQRVLLRPINSYEKQPTPSKARIRWTHHLHKHFLECVDYLGGAEKATPKAILKLMDVDGLTIFHVKSHLQKFRIARHIPESMEEKLMSDMNNKIGRLDTQTGIQLAETLRLQLDVQKQLHQQLEVQRHLQLHIEEQGRQLKQMLDQQLSTDKQASS